MRPDTPLTHVVFRFFVHVPSTMVERWLLEQYDLGRISENSAVWRLLWCTVTPMYQVTEDTIRDGDVISA